MGSYWITIAFIRVRYINVTVKSVLYSVIIVYNHSEVNVHEDKNKGID